jgi:hypothetical protein
MDREKGRPRHAVLQAGPRRAPERTAPTREPLIERADMASVREDLRTREVESSRRAHVHLPYWLRLGTYSDPEDLGLKPK